MRKRKFLTVILKEAIMNKIFSPTLGTVITIIGASVCHAETPSPSACQEQPGIRCLPVTFHNQSMTFVPPKSSYRKHYGPIPERKYTINGHITITPYIVTTYNQDSQIR